MPSPSSLTSRMARQFNISILVKPILYPSILFYLYLARAWRAGEGQICTLHLIAVSPQSALWTHPVFATETRWLLMTKEDSFHLQRWNQEEELTSEGRRAETEVCTRELWFTVWFGLRCSIVMGLTWLLMQQTSDVDCISRNNTRT